MDTDPDILDVDVVLNVIRPALLARGARRIPPSIRRDDYWLDDYRSLGPGGIPPAYAAGRWARPRSDIPGTLEGGSEGD